jgi:hypothetical protein
VLPVEASPFVTLRCRSAGLMQRMVEQLFDEAGAAAVTVHVTVFQLVDDRISDLLHGSQPIGAGKAAGARGVAAPVEPEHVYLSSACGVADSLGPALVYPSSACSVAASVQPAGDAGMGVPGATSSRTLAVPRGLVAQRRRTHVPMHCGWSRFFFCADPSFFLHH